MKVLADFGEQADRFDEMCREKLGRLLTPAEQRMFAEEMLAEYESSGEKWQAQMVRETIREYERRGFW